MEKNNFKECLEKIRKDLVRISKSEDKIRYLNNLFHYEGEEDISSKEILLRNIGFNGNVDSEELQKIADTINLYVGNELTKIVLTELNQLNSKTRSNKIKELKKGNDDFINEVIKKHMLETEISKSDIQFVMWKIKNEKVDLNFSFNNVFKKKSDNKKNEPKNNFLKSILEKAKNKKEEIQNKFSKQAEKLPKVKPILKDRIRQSKKKNKMIDRKKLLLIIGSIVGLIVLLNLVGIPLLMNINSFIWTVAQGLGASQGVLNGIHSISELLSHGTILTNIASYTSSTGVWSSILFGLPLNKMFIGGILSTCLSLAGIGVLGVAIKKIIHVVIQEIKKCNPSNISDEIQDFDKSQNKDNVLEQNLNENIENKEKTNGKKSEYSYKYNPEESHNKENDNKFLNKTSKKLVKTR